MAVQIPRLAGCDDNYDEPRPQSPHTRTDLVMVIDGNVIQIGTLNTLKSGTSVLTIKVLHRTYNPTARQFTGQVVYDVELRKQLAENAHASLALGDDVLIDVDEHDLTASIYTDSHGDDHPQLSGVKARNIGISLRSEALPITP